MNVKVGRNNSVWPRTLAVLVGIVIMALDGWTEKFESNEMVGTGWGLTEMVNSGTMEPDFAYQGSHGAIQAADIDGNNFPDVVVLADTSGLGVPPSRNVTQGPLGDLDGVTYVGSDLFWYMNDEFGSFSPRPVTIDIGGGIEGPPNIFDGRHLEVSDLDRDGDDDIVVWCNAGKVAWFENRRNIGWPGGFFAPGRPRFLQHTVVDFNQTFTVDGRTFETGNPRAGTLADMDNDGWIDLLVSNYDGTTANNSSLFWFRNTHLAGDNMFSRDSIGNINPIIIAGGGNHPYHESNGITVSAADMDGDGDRDIVLGEDGNGGNDDELTLLINNGVGNFNKISVNSNFRVSQSLAVQNLFDNGNPCQQEIIAGGSPGWNSPLSVFFATNGGCTSWTRAVLQNTSDFSFIWDVRSADFNNDGRPDIAAFWANDAANPATVLPDGRRSMCPIWINDGTSNPSNWTTIYLGEKGNPPGMGTENNGGIALADFDNDGDVDVMRSHVETNLVYFENTWNTERFFKIETTAQKNGMKQKVTSFLSTNPDRSAGRTVGQKVESQ